MGTAADKLALLQATKDDLKAALTEQGQTPGDVFSEYPDMVRAIETGVQLPELTSPGAAADLLSGKQLIDQEGNVVDGTLVVDASGGYYTSNGSNLATIDASGNLVIQPPMDIDISTIKGVENFGARIYASDTTNKEWREMLIMNYLHEFYDARYLHTFWAATVSPTSDSVELQEIDRSTCSVAFDETTKVLTLSPADPYLLEYSNANIYVRVTYLLN